MYIWRVRHTRQTSESGHAVVNKEKLRNEVHIKSKSQFFHGKDIHPKELDHDRCWKISKSEIRGIGTLERERESN